MLKKSIAGLFALTCFSTAAFAAPIGFSIKESTDELVTIDLVTGVVTVIGDTGTGDIEGLAFDSNGILYASDDTSEELLTLNTSTGARTTIGSFGTVVGNTGLSFNSADELFLADDSGDALYSVNITTGAITLIGSNGLDISAIAFDAFDTLYAPDTLNDQLVTLNTATGALDTVIGGIGLTLVNQQGLDFDAAGNLYLIDENTESLYSLNLTTGASTLIANLGSDFESLAILDIATVSEPGVLGLIGLGLFATGYAARRRKA